MLVPVLPTASVALIANRPKPEPMDGVNVSVPLQLDPLPESATGTATPSGGTKFKVGGTATFSGLLRVKTTFTFVEFVAWTGPAGAVRMLPAGGTTSITSGAPEGFPLKLFPARSCAATFTSASPECVNIVTLKVASHVFNAVFVRFNSVGDPAPSGRTVRFGVEATASFAVRVTLSGPTPTGDEWSYCTANAGAVAS